MDRMLRLVATVLLLSPIPAVAQDWPTKQPVKVIVPFTAGSATDIVARTVFEQVGKQVGQTFVIENRGGAGTTIGMGMVAKADPDGYTLLANSTSQVVVASTYARLPFSVTDFSTIGVLANMPYVVAAPTKYKTMKDLIDAGKKGQMINYGSAGAGSSGQLFMEALRIAGGYSATHIPFRGTPEGMNEIVAGRLDLYAAPAVSALELARDGKVSALAVSSEQRMKSMPDVPSMAEVGLPSAVYNFWVGAFAPAKTPRPIIDRLNREIVAALRVKEIEARIAALGGEALPMTPSAADAFIKKETQVNAEIVKASGFQPQ